MASQARDAQEKMALPAPADVQADGRVAECSICYEAYKGTSSGRAPKLLRCRHSVCLACLGKLACRKGAFSFVVCPFCRMVTVVPKGGLRALGNDESLLREMPPAQGGVGADTEEEPEDDKDALQATNWSLGSSGLSLEFSYRPGSPVFTVSSFTPAYSAGLHPSVGVWGSFHVQEVRNTVLVELPNQAPSCDSEMPAVVENLRLCFAVTILLLIVSVFFVLVLFK